MIRFFPPDFSADEPDVHVSLETYSLRWAPTTNEATLLLIDEDLDDTDDTLCLRSVFNFKNAHWGALYQEQAGNGFDKERALYDLLDEDTGTGDDITGGGEV